MSEYTTVANDYTAPETQGAAVADDAQLESSQADTGTMPDATSSEVGVPSGIDLSAVLGKERYEAVTKPADGDVATSETPTDTEPDKGASETVDTQEKFNRALGERQEAIRKQYAPVTAFATDVVRTLGVKNLDEAMERVQDLLAEQLATKKGISKEDAVGDIARDIRIARLERERTAQQTTPQQQNDYDAWRLNVNSGLAKINDPEFTKAVLEQGSRYNQMLISSVSHGGMTMDELYSLFRGTTPKLATTPPQKKPPTPARSSNVGRRSPIDVSQLSDDEILRLAELAEQGKRVEL